MISDVRTLDHPIASPPGTPDRVAWYMVVTPLCRYNPDVLLRPRLAAIRRFYPGSRILVQPSETGPATVARWRGMTAGLGVDWLPSRPIHTWAAGVSPIAAMLEAYLDTPDPADFLIKIDLDARLWRRFRQLPHDRVGVFGTLESFASSGFPFGDFPHVQGGCYGMSRETAGRIREAGVLDCARLRDDPAIWVDGIADWRGIPEAGRTLEDGLLRWVAKEMGMRPFGYEEIDSRFLPCTRAASADFAVTHPHKMLEADEEAGVVPQSCPDRPTVRVN